MGIQVITSNAPTYKVFTGLLTQSGGDDENQITGGLLTIGVTYLIENDGGSGWDFTNVGAPNNDLQTYFIATGTTPTSWGVDGLLVYNTGAPTCIILENTLGNVWFEYGGGAGLSNVKSDNLFTNLKSTLIIGNCFWETGSGYVASGFDGPNDGPIKTLNFSGSGVSAEYLTNTPIEIKVYN